MSHPRKNSAEELIESKLGAVDTAVARKVARHVTEKRHISRNISQEMESASTLGQRAADKIASFGGSWIFIGIFIAVLIAWVILNSYILVHYSKAFDPYPYILLNLFLSMLASLQAPIILMSQNRQAEKDRQNAEHDYEVNLKAELEIMLLHEKIDTFREKQWMELLEIQNQQIKLLTDLLEEKRAGL